jgi:hypothetical protein
MSGRHLPYALRKSAQRNHRPRRRSPCAQCHSTLKGKVDKRQTLGSQENIRIDILLRTNVKGAT